MEIRTAVVGSLGYRWTFRCDLPCIQWARSLGQRGCSTKAQDLLETGYGSERPLRSRSWFADLLVAGLRSLAEGTLPLPYHAGDGDAFGQEILGPGCRRRVSHTETRNGTKDSSSMRRCRKRMG